jgi:hypothetical protein
MKLRIEIERTLGLMQAHLRHQRGGARRANSSVSLWILQFVILAPKGSSSERYFESLLEDACVVGRQLCELFPDVLARAPPQRSVVAPDRRPGGCRAHLAVFHRRPRWSPLSRRRSQSRDGRPAAMRGMFTGRER